MNPCSACPWVSGKPQDVEATNQPEVKEAAKRGAFFACHTGQRDRCIGAENEISSEL